MPDWTLEQLTGPPGDRKKLTLSGYAAPFGRPRKDPILNEKQKLRVQQVRYPGSSAPPTYNVFGADWEEFEMKGRWMTRYLPDTTANDLADQWTTFFRDQRLIRISWGSIVSYTGMMSELELGRESEDEIAWKMTFLVDEREGVSENQQGVKINTPQDYDASIGDLQLFLSKALPGAELDGKIRPDFLDSLNDLASELNKPSAALNKLVGQFDNFEKATFSAIAHFRSAVTGVQTAMVNMREAVLNVEVDSILVVRNAQSDVAWLKYQTEFDNDSSAILASLAFLDRKAELATKSDASKSVVARDGDTWETLATKSVGLSRAGELRALNGAHYGEQPIPGVSYVTP